MLFSRRRGEKKSPSIDNYYHERGRNDEDEDDDVIIKNIRTRESRVRTNVPKEAEQLRRVGAQVVRV